MNNQEFQESVDSNPDSATEETHFDKRLFEITSALSFLLLVLFSYSGFNQEATKESIYSLSTESSQFVAFATVITSLLAITLFLKPFNWAFISSTTLTVAATALICFPLRNPLVPSDKQLFGISMPDLSLAFKEPQMLSNTIVIHSLLLPLVFTSLTSTSKRRYITSLFILSLLLASIIYKVKIESLSAVGVSVSFGFGLYLFWLTRFLLCVPSKKDLSDLKTGIVLTTLVHLPIFAFLSQSRSGVLIWMVYFVVIFSAIVLTTLKTRNSNTNEF